MGSLISAVVWSWKDFFNNILKIDSSNDPGAGELIGKAMTVVTTIVWIIFGIVGLCGIIYSIYLGIQLARADETSKREEAKKHLTTVIIALGVTLVLVIFFLHFLPAIISAFQNIDPNNISGNGQNT